MSEGKIAFGECILDVAGCVLRRRGKPVSIRRKAFHVLVYLLEHRERVVSKDELIREVWDGASMSDDVLVSTIHAVRAAVGESSREPFIIRTVHGYGYQFVADVVEAADGAVGVTRVRSRIKTLAAVAAGAAVLAMVGGAIVARIREGSGQAGMPKESVWFRLDEPGGDVVVDSSTGGNRGRMVGDVRRVEGVLGSALEFGGLNGYVIGDSVGRGFPAGHSARTVTCWIRTRDQRPGDRGILHWGYPSDVPSRSNFHLFLTAGRIGWGNGYGQGYVRSDLVVADGTWHFVAGVYSGSPLHSSWVYVDTHLVGEAAVPVPSDTLLKAPWRMGIFLAGGAPFQGTLDDLRIFPGALTVTQIKALYNCSLPRAAYEAPFRGRAWYLPLGESEPNLGNEGANDVSIPLENQRDAFDAVEFAVSDGACASDSLRGARFQPPVRIAMDVELPGDGFAGPFVDAPRMSPTDSPIDGKYPAYWVTLGADGAVAVRALGRGDRVLAKSAPAPGFERSRSHYLVVERLAGGIEAYVDGTPRLRFVSTPDPKRRAAGVAFRIEGTPIYDRPQRVRNVVVSEM